MFCFFKQKTAYEMRISDWSSDVCSSDLKVPAAEACVCTMLFSRILALRNSRSTDMEITAAGMADENVGPTFRPRNTFDAVNRSEERRVGKECVSTCRSRW